MSRIIKTEVDECQYCPEYYETRCINGLAFWCGLLERQITGKDYDLDFPEWCPLPIKKEDQDGA